MNRYISYEVWPYLCKDYIISVPISAGDRGRWEGGGWVGGGRGGGGVGVQVGCM